MAPGPLCSQHRLIGKRRHDVLRLAIDVKRMASTCALRFYRLQFKHTEQLPANRLRHCKYHWVGRSRFLGRKARVRRSNTLFYRHQFRIERAELVNKVRPAARHRQQSG